VSVVHLGDQINAEISTTWWRDPAVSDGSCPKARDRNSRSPVASYGRRVERARCLASCRLGVRGLAESRRFEGFVLNALRRAGGRRRTERGPFGVILSTLLLLAAMVPFCTVLGTRITLQVQGGGRGAARRLNPDGGPLFYTTDRWPPFVGSSLPFWAAAACLVAAMIILYRSPEVDGLHSLDVPLVAYMGFVGGVWGIIFALPFRDLNTWPRDSAIAGVIQIICAIRVVVEVIRGRRHRRNQRRVHEQATFAESTDGKRWHRVRPAGAGLPSGDEASEVARVMVRLNLARGLQTFDHLRGLSDATQLGMKRIQEPQGSQSTWLMSPGAQF